MIPSLLRGGIYLKPQASSDSCFFESRVCAPRMCASAAAYGCLCPVQQRSRPSCVETSCSDSCLLTCQYSAVRIAKLLRKLDVSASTSIIPLPPSVCAPPPAPAKDLQRVISGRSNRRPRCTPNAGSAAVASLPLRRRLSVCLRGSQCIDPTLAAGAFKSTWRDLLKNAGKAAIDRDSCSNGRRTQYFVEVNVSWL